MNIQKKYITEFIGLDLMRFVLSVIVVVRHYYHFYGPFKDGPFKDTSSLVTEQPFYNLLGFIYNQGHYAVHIFWLISGLIFFSVYHKEVVTREISFKNFAFLRFSRLYPLHLLTLLIALAAQLFFFQVHGSYFVYQGNDLRHFFLQLFFMGSWFPAIEHSFNVPIWSVSIEIFVYIIFYLITAVGLTKGNRLYLILGLTLIFNFFGFLPPFNTCLLFFFSGCVLAKLLNDGVPVKSLFVGYVFGSVSTIIAIKVLKYALEAETLFPYNQLLFYVRIILISSALVLVFIVAFRNVISKSAISLFRNLGNMTYSMYLVHFPLQIIIFLVLQPNDYRFFNNPLVFFSFIVASMLAGWITFEYFEKPVQNYLRKKYAIKMAAAAPRALPVNEAYGALTAASTP